MNLDALQVNNVTLDTETMNSLFDGPSGNVGGDDILGGIKDEPNPNGDPAQKAPDAKTDATTDEPIKKLDIKLDENVLGILSGDSANANSNEPAGTTNTGNANEPSGEGNGVLANVQNFLIEKGLWADYEGREEVEMTNENFAEIAMRQAEFMANQKLKNVVEELPEEAQHLLRYIAKGGDPYQVADLFKQRQNVVNMKPQTASEKEQYIQSYYKTLSWTESRIKSHMDRIKAGGDMAVEDEFKEVQPLFQQHYDSKIQEAERNAERSKKDEQGRVEMFEQNVTSALQSRQDLSTKEKEFVFDALLNYDQQLNDGRRVNKFFVAFAQAQTDLNSYIDLALYLTDRKKFEQRIIERNTTNNTKKSFDFLSSSGNSNTGNNRQAPKPAKTVGTNFSFLTS
jgi:hypothetical protein